MTPARRRPRLLALVLLGAALTLGGTTAAIVASASPAASVDAEAIALPASAATTPRRDVIPLAAAVVLVAGLALAHGITSTRRPRRPLPLRVDLRDPGRARLRRRGPPA